LKTSIIIVNYNTKEVLKECIESVHRFELPGEFEIIIVDNASKDNSAQVIEELKQQYKNIKSIYINELKSFSYANNRGFRISSGDYILIMNPDIIFESPLLGRLTDYLKKNKEVGAIGPALFYKDGEFQKFYYQSYPTFKQFIFYHSPLVRLFIKSKFIVNRYITQGYINVMEKRIFYVEHLPGAFFLTTRKIFEEIGLMDENFILFYEDVDLSFRINKKYKLAVDTRLQVKHLGGSSIKGLEWWVYGRLHTSMLYFFKKHYSKLNFYTLKYLLIFISKSVLLIDKVYKIFGKDQKIRIKKHTNFLDLVKEV
jgi:GT2 family glycosyltransferase